MKHLTKHTSRSAFDSVKASLATPHVALISYGHNKIVGYKKDGDSGFNEHVLEGTVAGDIAYYNGTEVKFCSADSWSESLGTPIGVVVIPSSHREDGKSVVMSLANMSLKTPETGSLATGYVEDDNCIGWGSWDDVSLPKSHVLPVVDGDDGTSIALLEYAYMRVDIPDGIYTQEVNYDGEWTDDISKESESLVKKCYSVNNGIVTNGIYYHRDDTESEWEILYEGQTLSTTAIYPYNEDGSKNENFQYAGSAFESLDGKANQDIIMAACTAGATGVIENSWDEGNYPAARACSRFHTVGTEAGDWYLPSIGEIAYLWAGVSKVAHAIEVLGASKAVAFRLGLSVYLVSSTSGGRSYGVLSNSAWYLWAEEGYVYGDYEMMNYSDVRVRAFCVL